jgi:hypothetical protein
MKFCERILTKVRICWLSFMITWYESEEKYLTREIARRQRILDQL